MDNFAEKFYDSESKEVRSNLWTFCIYPNDSLPENYLNIIQNWHIPTLLSPIHDADISGNGMEKKKHIHVMIYFGRGANKSFCQVSKYVKKLNGCQPESVGNGPGLIRYFIHRDNPEKAQRSKGMNRDWNIYDIISFSGFEYLEAFDNANSDDIIYESIESFITNNDIHNYFILVNLMKKANMKTEVSFIRRHSIHFVKYLDGSFQNHVYNLKVSGKDEESKNK